jgi:hypothetical protein
VTCRIRRLLYCLSSGDIPNKEFHAVLLVHLFSETVVLLKGNSKNHASVKKEKLEEK